MAFNYCIFASHHNYHSFNTIFATIPLIKTCQDVHPPRKEVGLLVEKQLIPNHLCLGSMNRQGTQEEKD
jgi:hypothetical protein